jgi:hypothetical protein
MRRYLEAATLADLVSMAKGQGKWPSEVAASPSVTPPWASGS